jgi:hypothetical protein
MTRAETNEEIIHCSVCDGDHYGPECVTCGGCGGVTADMGRNVACDECGDPLPYHDFHGRLVG